MEPPQCDVCLDLEWARLPELQDRTWERRLIEIDFQTIRSSHHCQICTVITNAILELSKPLESHNLKSNRVRHPRQIRIYLRHQWTTRVNVWDEDYSYFDFELYTSNGTPPVAAFGMANEISPTLDIHGCTRFLLPNIRNCDALHIRCKPKLLRMPSRLVYVGSNHDPTCLRLVESVPTLQPYIALSHCWGDKSAIFTTTKATIQDLLLEIPWTNMPKTFQDAISVTRSLKISYLWIDSLCIIQDDPSDWKVESLKMAEIYNQAYLTIAATSASSANSGFLSWRWHETDGGVNIPHSLTRQLSNQASSTPEVKARYYPRAHSQFQGILDPPTGGAPLWNRAWAFQERILSNRLIHFHGEEMIWECQETRVCECGYFAWDCATLGPIVPKFSIGDDLEQPQGMRLTAFEKWLEIVKEFSKLDISYESDRLPAISGIASALSKRMQSSYTAGLWEYRLGLGLLWRKMPYQLSRRINGTPDRYIPSWSWASVELLSDRKFFGLHLLPIESEIGLDKNFGCTTHNSPTEVMKSFVEIQDAVLQVEGLIISCALTHQHDVEDEIYPTHLVCFRGDAEFAYTDITCEDKLAQEDADVTCLLLAATSDVSTMMFDHSGSLYIIQYALVLQSNESGDYTRIGISEHDGRKGWFDNAKLATLRIL